MSLHCKSIDYKQYNVIPSTCNSYGIVFLHMFGSLLGRCKSAKSSGSSSLLVSVVDIILKILSFFSHDFFYVGVESIGTSVCSEDDILVLGCHLFFEIIVTSAINFLFDF